MGLLESQSEKGPPATLVHSSATCHDGITFIRHLQVPSTSTIATVQNSEGHEAKPKLRI